MSSGSAEHCTDRVVRWENAPRNFSSQLGVIIDSARTFKLHISSVVSSCFYQLRRMKSSLKLLPFNIARTVVNCFVVSRIDYCNSLLANGHSVLWIDSSGWWMQQRDLSGVLVGWHPYLVCCETDFIGCACLSESGTSSVF